MRPYDEFTILALEETLAWSKFANEASQSRCLDLLKNAVSHRPNSAFIQHALGNQLQDSDLDTAILHLSKAIELDPAAPAYYNVRGHAYLWKEQYDNAIRDFEIALAIDPTYVNAAMQKANCLVSKGMRKEAKDFLSSLRESDFESFDFVYIGGLMVMIDEVEKAEQYFQKAIKLEPSNRDAFVELADVLSDENPTNFENLLRQAKENLSARDFASVEIMVCARTGGLRKIHDLTKNGTESLSSMSVLLVKAFRTSLGDSKALQSILEDKKVPAQSISKIIDEFENAGTITVSVPVGQPGSVSLLTSTGIREIASGTSSIIKVGLSFDAEFDASSTKLPSYVPVVCFFTGDRTVLGEEKWQLAPQPLGSA
jgi:tetratricopeptide (TPR) repeat protein